MIAVSHTNIRYPSPTLGFMQCKTVLPVMTVTGLFTTLSNVKL